MNQKIIAHLLQFFREDYAIIHCVDLKTLPHFDPEKSLHNLPAEIDDLRINIRDADAVLICSPEYVFSIPSGLKNVIEWCVAATVFTNKPVAIITASSSGIKAHEELQMLMKTLGAIVEPESTLLIAGVKGKVNVEGEITDRKTVLELQQMAESFNDVLSN